MRLFFLPILAFSGTYADGNLFSIVFVAGRMFLDTKCLKIELARGAVAERYWLDVERGGNALKYELLDGPNLRMHTVDVELKLFRSNGGQVFWLPIRAKRESFLENVGLPHTG